MEVSRELTGSEMETKKHEGEGGGWGKAAEERDGWFGSPAGFDKGTGLCDTAQTGRVTDDL